MQNPQTKRSFLMMMMMAVFGASIGFGAYHYQRSQKKIDVVSDSSAIDQDPNGPIQVGDDPKDDIYALRTTALLANALQNPTLASDDPLHVIGGRWPKLNSPGQDCADPIRHKGVSVSEIFLGKILVNGSATLVRPPQLACFATGDVVYLIVGIKYNDLRVAPVRAVARVKKLGQIAIQDVPELNTPAAESAREAWRKQFGANVDLAPWVSIDLEVLGLIPGTNLLNVLGPVHPSAKAIDRLEFKALAEKNAMIIDTRRSDLYATGRLGQAINLPTEFMVALEVANSGSSESRLPSGVLPQTKETPLIFYGDSPTDRSPYYALTAAAKQGYKNLYWYWEGADRLRNRWVYAPLTAPGATSIGFGAAIRLARQGAAFVDVRSPSEFASQTLTNSINASFKTDTETGVQRPGLSAAEITKAGEGINLELIPKNRPLIVFGSSPQDWRAYKTIALLAGQHQKELFYLFGGYRETVDKSLLSEKLKNVE